MGPFPFLRLDFKAVGIFLDIGKTHAGAESQFTLFLGGGAVSLLKGKLDILDGLPELKICVAYRLDGHEIDHLPASERAQAAVEPIYETFEGWQAATAGARSWAELPAQAIKYVRHVEELVGCPVALLSTSPERDDTILMQNPFEN